MDGVLSARHVVEYPYRRSLGPVLGRFFAGLRERRVLGARLPDGRVMCPPAEYDPATGAQLSELVQVGDAGVVTTWTWVASPRAGHPLSRPFAFALVRLDGADTAMLHAVDAGLEEHMRTGMRVRARWAREPVGGIRDIACFEVEPEGLADRSASPTRSSENGGESDVALARVPVRLEYEITPGRAQSRFLRALSLGRLVGQRCPRCEKVYLPPRGACPTCGVATEQEVPLGDTGAVTSFCIVNVPSGELAIAVPYIAASVLIDGADTPIFHVVQGISVDEVRMGLRVRAEWRPRQEWGPTLESIRCFRPTGEPDATFDAIRGAL